MAARTDVEQVAGFLGEERGARAHRRIRYVDTTLSIGDEIVRRSEWDAVKLRR